MTAMEQFTGRIRMSISDTRRRLSIAFAIFVASAANAGESDVAFRMDSTLGVRLYDPQKPFDDESLSSYFDQHRYMRRKDDTPWFADLFHADLGLVRPDGTHLLRLERWSPNWLNQRGTFELDWRGLDLEVGYLDYRSDDLRFYPVGTGAPVPTLGSAYNPDTPPGNARGEDLRLYSRRSGVTGVVRARPDGFGIELPFITGARAYSGYEKRRGRRQDRYLLEDSVDGLGSMPQRSRFRADRIRHDQAVTSVGGSLVFQPLSRFSGVADFHYEAFRENASVSTLGDLAARDPNIPEPLPQRTAARALFFVPDTDRFSGSVATTGRIGRATVHLGGFATHLKQAGRRAPLQDLLGLGDNRVTTWSMHGSFDVPLGWSLALGGFVKTVHRDNQIDEDAFTEVSADGVQVNSYMRRRREVRAGLELAARPMVGTRLVLGSRVQLVERDLRFGQPPGAILDEYNLIESDSEQHTLYLGLNTRLLRSLRLSGELGYEWAPQVALARDFEESVYFQGRGHYTWVWPVPITLAAFGKVVSGSNDEIELESSTPGRSKRKEFERIKANYGLNLTAILSGEAIVFATFAHSWDEQEFAYLRSNDPRNFGPSGLEFFVDSDPRYRGENQHASIGAQVPLGSALDLNTSFAFTRVRAGFADSSRSAGILEGSSEIDGRVWSVEGNLAYDFDPSFRVGIGYRFDRFEDEADLELLDLDTWIHTYTLTLTYRIPGS